MGDGAHNPQSQTALVLLGGFLGSGKTTLMVELARRLSANGKSVALITNDQGDDLVDTAYASAAGFAANEIGGGCFCCNFSTFVANITSILEVGRPDFVLAEPVGSCTDLVATVLSPLELFHANLVSLAGYYVLVDAPRMNGEYRSLSLADPITPREVLVSHQLREAPRVLLSKCDLVDSSGRDQALAAIAELTGAPVTPVAVAGGHSEGLDQVVDEICSGNRIALPDALALDYDQYAAAEAEMGWYNGIATARSASGLLADELAMDILLRIRAIPEVETLHAKVLVNTQDGSIKASLVSGAIRVDVAIADSSPAHQLGLTLNVRAVVDPRTLGREISRIVKEAFEELELEQLDYRYNSLVPGRPIPEHRIAGRLRRSD